MLSLYRPLPLTISSISHFSKIKGPNNFQIKKVSLTHISLIQTGEGFRLILQTKTSTRRASRYKIFKGFSIGWQKHLRLVGVGFRANIIDISFEKEYLRSKFIVKNYLRKRILYFNTRYPKQKNQFLKLKIGFSHEVIYPRIIRPNKYIKVSSLDGRSKGRLICIKSDNKIELNQMRIEIRSFRFPETYKHKGIYYNKESIKLKKGKRQN